MKPGPFQLSRQVQLRLIAAILAAGVLIPDLVHALHFVSEPGRVTGWEAAWIAQSIVTGHGFSFPEIHRWLFAHVDTGRYFPTAWVDPLYTYALAGLMFVFGPSHAIAAVWLNAVLLLVAFALIYMIAERWFSPVAGMIVIVIMGLSHVWLEAIDDMNNTLLATALVCAAFALTLHLCTRPTTRGAVVLGIAFGTTALGCPSAILLAPATALMIVCTPRAQWPQRWLHAIVIGIVTIVVILPWTIRNYETFGQLIPIRDGGGLLAFVGTISLAEVVDPALVDSPVRPSWHAKTIRDAVDLAQSRDNRRELEQFPLDYAGATAGPGFESLDEAQRDAWLATAAKRFAVEHPGFVAAASVPKLELFLRVLGGFGRVTLLLACLAVLFAFRDLRARIAGAWIAAFVAPFGLIICYFDRYRAPIEPIVMLLALYGLWHVARRVTSHAGIRMSPWKTDRS